MHLLLRPAPERPRPGLRPGLPDGLDPVRADRDDATECPQARRRPARPGGRVRLPLRRGRRDPRRPERLLSLARTARDVSAARQGGADRPEPQPLAVVDQVGRGLLGDRPRGLPGLRPAQAARGGERRRGPEARGPEPVDPYVADPDWGWLIIGYFYLGGIAAGSYAIARMVDLFGAEDDRAIGRIADFLALPIVSVCGLLLVVDLGRPERFWHMLIADQTWRPMFKWWSPMSVGSWGLSVFGGFSFVSFLGVLADGNRSSASAASGPASPPCAGAGSAGCSRSARRDRPSSSAPIRGPCSRPPISRSGRNRPGSRPSFSPRRSRMGLAAF